jgi:hypothetical protein
MTPLRIAECKLRIDNQIKKSILTYSAFRIRHSAFL